MVDNLSASAPVRAPTPDVEPLARREIPSWAITTLSVVGLLGVWQLFGRGINPAFGSYPSAILQAFWELVESGDLGTALSTSLQAFAAGFVLSIIVGVPLGLVIGQSRVLEAAIGIYVTAANAMPLVAFVPLLVLWFGLGFAVKAVVVFLMSFSTVCINTWLGVRAVPTSLVEVGRAFVAPTATILRRIILPATLPYIMAGLKLAVGRAVVAMVIAEFFTAISGLGGIIINSANNFDTASMFVPIVILMILATLLNNLVGWIERRVAPWQFETSDH